MKSTTCDRFHQHKPWLQQWLTYKLGCNRQAADLVQDTSLRLIAKRLEILKEPKAYLRVIANGLLNDQYSRHSVRSTNYSQRSRPLVNTNTLRPPKISNNKLSLSNGSKDQPNIIIFGKEHKVCNKHCRHCLKITINNGG